MWKFQTTVWQVPHAQLLYPYHLANTRTSANQSPSKKKTFSKWFLEKHAGNLEFPSLISFTKEEVIFNVFPSHILFTEEKAFSRYEIIYLHKQHVMAIKNLHGTLHSKHQQQFSLNVPDGIARNRLLGSYTLPPCLTETLYKMSFHSCCTLRIYRLGLIYCSHMTVLQHIFFLHSHLHKCVSKTKDKISAPTA
jgi:hypothetical protein